MLKIPLKALDLLTDNILGAVDRDDSSYQAVLTDNVEHLVRIG